MQKQPQKGSSIWKLPQMLEMLEQYSSWDKHMSTVNVLQETYKKPTSYIAGPLKWEMHKLWDAQAFIYASESVDLKKIHKKALHYCIGQQMVMTLLQWDGI